MLRASRYMTSTIPSNRMRVHNYYYDNLMYVYEICKQHDSVTRKSPLVEPQSHSDILKILSVLYPTSRHLTIRPGKLDLLFPSAPACLCRLSLQLSLLHPNGSHAPTLNLLMKYWRCSYVFSEAMLHKLIKNHQKLQRAHMQTWKLADGKQGINFACHGLTRKKFSMAIIAN